MYSMRDLSSRVKRTPQALYSLIKQNESLSSVVKENTEKNGRFIKYGEPVLSWLMDYYKITEPTADEVGEGIVEPEAQEIPQHTAPEARESVLEGVELLYLKRENDLLRGQIEALKKDKEEKQNEINRLLLLLQEEKQEKQMLLAAAPQEAPADPAVSKLTFIEKIKSFFGK